MFTTYHVPQQRSQSQKASTPVLNVWFAKLRHAADRMINRAEGRQTGASARVNGKCAGKSLNAA